MKNKKCVGQLKEFMMLYHHPRKQYDESSISFGEKLADTDLIGIPYQIIIKQKKIENALVELKNGKTDEIKEMSIEQVIARFM